MNNLVIFLVVAVSLGYQGLGIEGANIRREELFKLDLIHFNDFHARFEETSTTSTKCSPPAPCIGGLPRLFTGIKRLRAQHPDSVVLNAGDSFQGTLWYNLLRWNVTQYFMNMLPLDAHTLGNHEFDNGISGLVPYLQNLKAKMLDCNIDDSLEPTIQGLYQDSLVIERKGRKIGIIGVILQTTNLMANTEKLKFTDEITAVKRVAEKLTQEGVDIIIVLSHCGIDVDRLIAAGAGPNIDLIVGGHTHTLLYPKGETPPNGVALDDYPIAVNQTSGTTVLIVQASAYTKYLGFLEIFFDSNGKVNNWNGRPIYLDASIEQDQEIVKLMEPYKTQVDALGKRVLGTTNVQLDKSQCYSGECNIGNFITDAFVDHLVKGAEPGYWAYAAACIIGQGGIRTNIEIGTITYEDLVIAQPFNNILQTFDIKGKYILEALEHGTSDSLSKDLFMGQYMVQVSGLNVVYNVTRPIGNRVVSATIRCAKCPLPATYSPIEPETKYRFAAPDFLGNGGDGFSMFADNRENIKNWGVDIDILEEYIAKESPINAGLEGRITILK